MNGDYEKKPRFEFDPASGCTHGTTCVQVLQEGDSILFNGKLTVELKEYKVTLKNDSTFTFTFGKALTTTTTQPKTTPHTTTVTSTSSVEPTDEPGPEPQPGTEKPDTQPETPSVMPAPTEQSETETGSIPPEPTQPSGDSNSNDNNGNEQETDLTTSSGMLNGVSVASLILIFASLLGWSSF